MTRPDLMFNPDPCTCLWRCSWTCVPRLGQGRLARATSRTLSPACLSDAHSPCPRLAICIASHQPLQSSARLKTHSPKHPAPTPPSASSLRLYPNRSPNRPSPNGSCAGAVVPIEVPMALTPTPQVANPLHLPSNI